jgi:hypothetical protein
VLREVARGAWLSRARVLKTFLFHELWRKVEIHRMTGWVVECTIDAMNRPCGARARLRIPPAVAQVKRLFLGWREELAPAISSPGRP